MIPDVQTRPGVPSRQWLYVAALVGCILGYTLAVIFRPSAPAPQAAAVSDPTTEYTKAVLIAAELAADARRDAALEELREEMQPALDLAEVLKGFDEVTTLPGVERDDGE